MRAWLTAGGLFSQLSQTDTLNDCFTFQRIEEIMKRTRKGDQSDLKVGPTEQLACLTRAPVKPGQYGCFSRGEWLCRPV